jgi:cell division protein FtsN
MANSERGIGPTIDLQGFDLRTDMDTIDEPSRLPLLVVIALVVLAAFAGVVWLAYTQGVERGRASVSREVLAREIWAVRKSNVPPYTGLNIYEPAPTPAAQKAAARLAPKHPAASAIPALRPSASAVPESPPPLATAAKPATPTPGANAAPQAPVTATQKAPAPAKPQLQIAPAAHPQASAPQPQRVATRGPTELLNLAAAPPTHPITSLDSPTLPQRAAARPAATASAPPAFAPPVPATMSGVVLQIGSYKSEAEARQSWNSFRSRHDAAAGYQADVKAVDLGARGTWYRLRMGPFADRKAALSACTKLKADGASCLLAQ